MIPNMISSRSILEYLEDARRAGIDVAPSPEQPCTHRPTYDARVTPRDRPCARAARWLLDGLALCSIHAAQVIDERINSLPAVIPLEPDDHESRFG